MLIYYAIPRKQDLVLRCRSLLALVLFFTGHFTGDVKSPTVKSVSSKEMAEERRGSRMAR